MNKRLIALLPLIFAVVLGVILFNGLGKDATLLESARLNDPMPAFKLPTLKDEAKLISEQDLKGRVVLVNVWATWCPSCRAEHPMLLKLASQGVPVIGLDYKDERDAAMEWLRTLGDPYEYVIFDKQGTLGFDMGVYGAPETYVVDKQGIIRHRHVGVIDDKAWNEKLKPMMDKLNQEKPAK